MNNLSDMIWIEQRKALRSGMPLWTALGSLFMPLGMAFLIFVARNPEISRRLGLVSAKADLLAYSATDWPGYLAMFGQLVAAIGIFLFSLATSWTFGREFADGTLKEMLAVPVPRSTILLAKFIVVALWSVLLTALILVSGLVTGALIRLPGGSIDTILSGGAMVAVTACLTIVVITPFAFLAGVGRGYLLPIGGAILALLMANIVVLAGWGDFFPWSIPGLYATGSSPLPPVSYAIVILTGLAGLIATHLWWTFADQSR